MQRIYEPQDLLEAELLCAMLGSEGVEVHLVGRDLLGAVGELPVGGLLGLLVDEQAVSNLLAQARERAWCRSRSRAKAARFSLA